MPNLSDAIDEAKPVQGNPTTQSVRDNFAAAKSAIAQLELTAGVGPKGDKGDQGPVGPGATVSVGTVTTGSAGTNATVNNTGTATAATLNFTIPRGDSGTAGGGITETQAINAVRQGQPRFEETTVTTAVSWPTANIAVGPSFQDEWSLSSGSGPTATYTRALDATATVLAYPAGIVSGNAYQIAFSNTATTEPSAVTGTSQWFNLLFRNGATNTTGQQQIRMVNGGSGETVNIRATGNFTHFVVVPLSGWAGNFTLQRISTGGAESSKTFDIKNFPVIADSSRLFIGNGGRFATGNNNFGIGTNALRDLSSGSANIAMGTNALQCCTNGSSNLALGENSLQQLTTGSSNIGLMGGLPNLRSGTNNVAVGSYTLPYITNSQGNVCVGYGGLSLGEGCHYNVGMGYQYLGYGGPPAVSRNMSYNVALGYYTIRWGKGSGNIAVGSFALSEINKPSGTGSAATGDAALTSNNAALGHYAGCFRADGSSFLQYPGDSVFVGAYTKGASGDNHHNQIVIGYGAIGSGSDTITLGNDDIQELHCNAQSISALSDPRVKENIQAANLDMCLDAVKKLPVHRWGWSPLAGRHRDRHVTGFLSDEIKTIFPKAVSQHDEWRAQRDADGHVLKKTVVERVTEGTQNEDGTWTQHAHNETREIEDRVLVQGVQRVQLTEILPTLWGAVQRLIERNEALEREIEILKQSR